MMAIYRSQASPTPNTYIGGEDHGANELNSASPAAFSAERPKGQEVSRGIAKEITAAQKVMQVGQWSEALKSLEAAETKSPLTNKPSYWNNLIRLERQDERDDHNTLMIYRVMYDTNSMQADTDYIEMAQLLGDAGLPGEAQAVLEKALAGGGIVKDEHKERTTRLLNAMRTRADADKKGLPQLDAEAKKNSAGQLDMKLGEVYYGAGDYKNAADAITRGLNRGAAQQDEAYVYLRRSQAILKNYTDARRAFIDLRTLPNIVHAFCGCGVYTRR